MERPRVINIENQKVETSEREVTGWEAEEILRKYGYTQDFRRKEEVNIDPSANMTFEELVKLEEEKRKSEELKRKKEMFGPKPITFESESGYDSEVKWGSDSESGLGFKIEITTDMKLPKY